jgi:A/G-specific adenine glycosylase
MLQQTRVEAVIPYFERFLTVLPTLSDVASADDDLLHKLWEGLGYYSRVRNIKQAAIRIMADHGGRLPSKRDELEALPGIGPYTAGAIRSIAFGLPDTAVDGNVLRVFARLEAMEDDIKTPGVKRRIRNTVASLLPEERIGDFNQALMEIGATVCLPNGSPRCEVCPLRDLCQAYELGKTDVIPKKQVKKRRRIEPRTVLLFQYQDKIGLSRRPSTGLLANLYEFPNEPGHLTIEELQGRYPGSHIEVLSPSKHVFSHLEWHMIGYAIDLVDSMDDLIWATRDRLLDTYSIPTAFSVYREHWLSKR